ncbi:MAG: hypothetical protein ACP5XB_04920 [Isosphaeraceae bacterium]
MPSILAIVEQRFASIHNIYADYEAWAFNKASKTFERKLHVQEAMDGERRWMRTVHFYRELYDNSPHPDYDPLLNWILWSRDSEIHFLECSRRAFIRSRRPVVDRIPYINGYFGYLGIAPSDRRAGTDIVDTGLQAWRPRDFFLPWALREPGWRIEPPEPGGELRSSVVIGRRLPFGSDRLWLDPRKNYAIEKREMRRPDGVLELGLRYRRLTEFAAGQRLPLEVVVDTGRPRSTLYAASVLEVNDERFSRLSLEYPPGTVVVDERSGRSTTVPGGDDLLDFTIDRARFFLEQNTVRRPTIRPVRTLFLGVTVCAILALGLFARGLNRRKSRGPEPGDLVSTSSPS